MTSVGNETCTAIHLGTRTSVRLTCCNDNAVGFSRKYVGFFSTRPSSLLTEVYLVFLSPCKQILRIVL